MSTHTHKKNTSTRFVFFILYPTIFSLLFIGFIFSNSLFSALLSALLISTGIIFILVGDALKKTVHDPDFFVKKILGNYERHGVPLLTYILRRDSINEDLPIPTYSGGWRLVWRWEEIVPVFGGIKDYKQELRDVFSPNDGISITTHLQISTRFSPDTIHMAIRECGEIKDGKILEENLKNTSDKFFERAARECRSVIHNFGSDPQKKVMDVINASKEISDDLRTSIEKFEDVQKTSNEDNLVETLGIIALRYNLELRPDEKVENAKEGVAVARLNKDAALEEVQAKKALIKEIIQVIKDNSESGKGPDGKDLTILTLSMLGNSNNVLMAGTGAASAIIGVDPKKKGGNN